MLVALGGSLLKRTHFLISLISDLQTSSFVDPSCSKGKYDVECA